MIWTLFLAFILVVSGFVLFGVNYYKAFQVKNNLLTLIEKYEGNVNNDKFKEKVESLVNRVGYHPGQSAIASLQNKSENYLSEGIQHEKHEEIYFGSDRLGCAQRVVLARL